jgi:hypothetical protein
MLIHGNFIILTRKTKFETRIALAKPFNTYIEFYKFKLLQFKIGIYLF